MTKQGLRAAVLGLLGLLAAKPVLAQSYEIPWWTVDGGGVTFATGGPYSLGATAGQHDASGALAGGTFSLVGGFWAGGGVMLADLATTKTDGQATAVPGLPITYTIVATNVGPSSASGATVTDVVPTAILGATWTCVGAGGGTCTASGSGSINDTVILPMGATVTYTLTGTLAASAAGSLANTAAVASPAGVTDPVPGNNSATDTDVLTPQTDLSMAKTDGQTTAAPGQPVTYTVTAANVGPSDAVGTTVTDVVPAILLGAHWTCVASAGSTCAASGSGSINDTVHLLVGGTATYTLTGTVDPLATGTLVNTAGVATGPAATDPDPSNNTATDSDTLEPRALAELVHGTSIVLDLASAGAAADVDRFRIRQQPYASYEVVIDEASGDLGSSGPTLERVAGDGATVVQLSQPVGVGFSRSLRWSNTTGTAIDDQTVRVRSAGCTTDCGADDTYRIRAYETTATVPRFNNAGTQLTVLLLQNPGAETITGTVYFWTVAGTLAGQQGFTLPPRQLLVLNTGTVVPGVGGSMSVVHDGPYDALVGKTVALEPATGFSFDSPLSSRPR
jgi:uncharacterized repeat protein (TIGR01451 family)